MAIHSDSELFETALMAAVARRRPARLARAVDPGWVPTKMGGPSPSDDLALAGHTGIGLPVTAQSSGPGPRQSVPREEPS